jgi:hypothetical protein
MIEKDMQIKELYDLKHINDKIETGFDYEEQLMTKSLSNLMFQNETTSSFLDKLKKLLIYTIESNLIIRNFFNPTISKYYNKHNN